MSVREHRGGIRVQRLEEHGDREAFASYEPRAGGGAGTLDYGPERNPDGLSSVQWLRERHVTSLGVPLSAGLFSMQPSAFDFRFVAEETMVFLEGAVRVEAEGATLQLERGDMAFFPAGVQTYWTVHEPTTVFFTLLD
jgi:uncharacterized cupin superfamily protein